VTRRALVALGLALGLAACGRKGPPVAPELVRPEPPERLAATAVPDGVRLTWLRPMRYSGGGRMHDLRGFLIERAPGPEAPFARVGVLELDDQTRFRRERRLEWLDRDVRPGEPYRYRVTALTLDGDRSPPAGPVGVRPAAPEETR
jgi:predicted small lipoprotein YifL